VGNNLYIKVGNRRYTTGSDDEVLADPDMEYFLLLGYIDTDPPGIITLMMH